MTPGREREDQEKGHWGGPVAPTGLAPWFEFSLQVQQQALSEGSTVSWALESLRNSENC